MTIYGKLGGASDRKRLSGPFICPICTSKLEFLGGEPAHETNLYCPKCNWPEEPAAQQAKEGISAEVGLPTPPPSASAAPHVMDEDNGGTAYPPSAATSKTPECDKARSGIHEMMDIRVLARTFENLARDLERRLRATVIERDELLHLNGVQADNVRSERTRAEVAERERDAERKRCNELVEEILKVRGEKEHFWQLKELAESELASVKADAVMLRAKVKNQRKELRRLNRYISPYWIGFSRAMNLGAEARLRGIMNDHFGHANVRAAEIAAIDKARAAKGGKT